PRSRRRPRRRRPGSPSRRCGRPRRSGWPPAPPRRRRTCWRTCPAPAGAAPRRTRSPARTTGAGPDRCRRSRSAGACRRNGRAGACPPILGTGVPGAVGTMDDVRDPIAAGLVLGAAADLLLADPRRGHPVAGFGSLAAGLERWIWQDDRATGVAYAGGLVAAAAGLGVALDRATRR